MARTHFWQYLRNEEGQPVNAADISVYLAGSLTSAYVYTQESGGSAVNTAPQLVTNSDGYFEFWIADGTETHGYTGQKFKVAWSAPGIVSDGFVDYIEMSISPAEVDETDTNLTKNKMVSNELARRWTNKANITTFAVTDVMWTLDTGNYRVDLTHNFDNAYPMVIIYSDVDGRAYVPAIGIAEMLTSSTTRVWSTSNNNCHITVIG